MIFEQPKSKRGQDKLLLEAVLMVLRENKNLLGYWKENLKKAIRSEDHKEVVHLSRMIHMGDILVANKIV